MNLSCLIIRALYGALYPFRWFGRLSSISQGIVVFLGVMTFMATLMTSAEGGPFWANLVVGGIMIFCCGTVLGVMMAILIPLCNWIEKGVAALNAAYKRCTEGENRS